MLHDQVTKGARSDVIAETARPFGYPLYQLDVSLSDPAQLDGLPFSGLRHRRV